MDKITIPFDKSPTQILANFQLVILIRFRLIKAWKE